MCLDICEARDFRACIVQSGTNDRLLSQAIGCSQAIATTILINRRPFDQRIDAIAITLGIAQAFQDHDTGSLAANITISLFIEGVAVPAGREHASLFESNTQIRIEQQVHPGHQGTLAFTTPQTVHGVVGRHE